MEEKSFVKNMFDQIEGYAKSTYELYKLKAVQSFATSFALISIGIIVGLIFTIVLLFASIGLALYLGTVLNGWHYGFFAVAGIYMLFAVVIYIYGIKRLKEQIAEYIIKQIFKD